MENPKFCASCGTARVGQAPFCAACGKPFPGQRTSASSNDWRVLLGISVVLTVVIWLGILWLGPTSKSLPDPLTRPGAGPAATAATAPDPHLEHMVRAAEGRDPAAIMTLVEYRLKLSEGDPTQLAQAAGDLKKLVDVYPNHGYALRLLGHIYFDLKMAELAEPIYRRYLELHPGDANVRTDHGTVLVALGRYQDAIAAYQQALASYPDFYNAYHNIAIAYTQAGDPVQAQVYETKAEHILQTKGKTLAPDLDLPRLPQGAPRDASTTATPLADGTSSAAISSSSSLGSGAGGAGSGSLATQSERYQALEQFFRTHAIIGPKIADFRVESGQALLLLNEFPMEAMPPFVRERLDQKINEVLKTAGPDASVRLLDAANRNELAAYKSP